MNFRKQIKLPFAIYANFTSSLKPIHFTQRRDDDKSFITFEHIPFSFCIYIKCSFDDSLSRLVIYLEAGAVKYLLKLARNAQYMSIINIYE